MKKLLSSLTNRATLIRERWKTKRAASPTIPHSFIHLLLHYHQVDAPFQEQRIELKRSVGCDSPGEGDEGEKAEDDKAQNVRDCARNDVED
jgi:hypothetical protein